jgi:hypothetical protein
VVGNHYDPAYAEPGVSSPLAVGALVIAEVRKRRTITAWCSCARCIIARITPVVYHFFSP